MTNLEKYDKAFLDSLGGVTEALSDLDRQSILEWDSVGHMQLITALEEAFGITFDTEDIIDFDSYERGKNILAKYGKEI